MRILKGTASETVDTRVLNGRNYLVVPVVALVEGVRHSGSSEHPELVLAEAFGKWPQTWDGRPVVVDHPQAADGSFLSASDPEVLENYQLGYIMNSQVQDGKLIVEAWIDLGHVSSSESDDITNMWERLDAGETIEVSVGAIVYTDPSKEGKYEGKQYKGVWDIVIPDHLAILATETGACSVADGCGTFRTESSGLTVFEAEPIALSRGQMKAARVYMSNQRRLKRKGRSNRGLQGDPKTVKSSDGGCQCDGACSCSAEQDEPATVLAAEAETEAELSRHREFAARFCFSDGLYNTDIHSLLSYAIREDNSEAYLLAYNDTYVVYDTWVPGKGYKLYREEYVADGDNAVLLSGDPEEVAFRTELVPLSKKSKSTDGGENKDKNMSKKTDTGGTDGDALEVSSTEELLERVGVNSEIGKQLASALALADKAKTDAVAKIMSAPGNKFTEEQLQGMDIEVLDNMTALLGDTTEANDDEDDAESRDLSGQPEPKNYGARPGGKKLSGDGNMAPAPPNVFGDSKAA